MPLYVRTGSAFQWRPTRLYGQASDVLRTFEHDGVQLALLANASDCGFSTCWPPGSRLILDLFVDAWSATSGPVNARLKDAFDRACCAFEQQSPALSMPDADFPDELPAATLLAVAVEGANVHMCWVGGDVALVARGFRPIAASTPHTLAERIKRERPDVNFAMPNVPDVIVRVIAKGSLTQGKPDQLSTTIEPGDTLILLSRSAFRGPCVTQDDAAFAAAAFANPEMLAKTLADVAFTETDAAYAAVVILRFDDMDLRATVERGVDALEADPTYDERVRTWSQKERALPVSYDLAGIVGMRGDGAVLEAAWNEPTSRGTSSDAHLAALIAATQKYPELVTLAPRRPAGAHNCPHCAATGCPRCLHLGWSAPTPPKWFLRTASTSADASGVQSAEKRSWWQRLFSRTP